MSIEPLFGHLDLARAIRAARYAMQEAYNLSTGIQLDPDDLNALGVILHQIAQMQKEAVDGDKGK